MTKLSLERELSIDVGVDIALVYREVCNSAHSVSYMSNLPYPTFEDLYDEYVSFYIEEHSQMTDGMIDEELIQLKIERQRGFTIEDGFRPEFYGISKEAELLNALLLGNYSFILDRRLINQPTLEVW